MIVCSCNVFSDKDVQQCLLPDRPDRPTNVRQVYGCLGCSAKCGRCARSIQAILNALVMEEGECPPIPIGLEQVEVA